jgi:hypothetical protein
MLILTEVQNGFDGLTDMNILTIVLVLFLVLNTIIFITKLKWLHLASSILWIVPLTMIDNIFIRSFCVIMILVSFILAFFNNSKEEYYE